MQKSSETFPVNSSKKLGSTKKSILTIDDSEDTLNLHKIMLESQGYEVFTAASGTEALALLPKIDKPDLILLDMQLGDMTGMQFLTFLENKIPQAVEDVPIVFISGIDEIPKSKAVGFIRKPIDMALFLKIVHSFIQAGATSSYKH